MSAPASPTSLAFSAPVSSLLLARHALPRQITSSATFLFISTVADPFDASSLVPLFLL